MTEILFKEELTTKISKGVNILSEAVGATLGPKGRTVIIKNKDRKAFTTKDGVTVAKSIKLNDPFENLGVEIIRQAAESTVANAGDGTTSSTVLAQAIYDKAQKYLIAGADPNELKKGMERASSEALKIIKENVKTISSLEEIRDVATISANGDKKIGELISQAVDKIGRDGSITIQEGRSTETILEVNEGFSFESGLISNVFITDERRSVMRYENALILITDESITAIDDILPILSMVARDKRPFVILSDNIEGQALAALILNCSKGTMKVAAIKAPRYGEERRNLLEDLSIITGATFITKQSGINLDKVELKHLGTAKIIESSRYSTVVVSDGNQQQKVIQKIESLKNQMQQTENMIELQKLQQRINCLASGVAIIRVGGSTEVEMLEAKHRIEDALEAVNAAQQEGIIAGGGVSFVRASKLLQNFSLQTKDQQLGVSVISEALEAPFKKILSNAGLSYELYKEKILSQLNNWDYGFDVTTGIEGSLLEKGVIDPYKVLRCSLTNAVSAASTLLNSSVAIIDK